jgi:hypothetical protein
MIDAFGFSPRVGDVVVASRDVLAEVARSRPGAPLRWELVEAGARGRLIGWRARGGEEPCAVVDLHGVRRMVVFVRERSVVRAPHW